MALDGQDILYVADHNKIYKAKGGQELDVFWQSASGNVEGFTLAEDHFAVKVTHEDGYELFKIDHESQQATLLMSQEYDNSMLLNNANKQADKFLFNRVKDIKKLVRLK